MLFAIPIEPLEEQTTILHSDTSSRHHIGAALKCDTQVFVTFYSSAKIDGKSRMSSYLFKRPIIYDMIGFRTVQIDQM